MTEMTTRHSSLHLGFPTCLFPISLVVSVINNIYYYIILQLGHLTINIYSMAPKNS